LLKDSSGQTVAVVGLNPNEDYKNNYCPWLFFSTTNLGDMVIASQQRYCRLNPLLGFDQSFLLILIGDVMFSMIFRHSTL
jgi:hypothetical protein